MKSFYIRETKDVHKGRSSVRYEVISPNGKPCLLGYTQSGKESYTTNNRSKAEKLCSQLTYSANVHGVNHAKLIENGQQKHNKYSRDKQQRKHFKSVVESVKKFGVEVSATYIISDMKVIAKIHKKN